MTGSRGLPAFHAGVLFRSRTEARWAVFFDHLGIKWDYEPQGFVSAGIPYLPDFTVYAALGTLWVEIKANWQADPEGVAKWRAFADRRPNPAATRAALLTGHPSLDGNYLVIGGDEDGFNPVTGGWDDDTQQWRPCPSGQHFDLIYPGLFHAKFAEDGCEELFGGDGDARLRDAVAAANSARFRRQPGGTAA